MINEKNKKRSIKRTTSVNISACLVHSPLTALKNALKEEDCFKGIIFSTTYIETYGKIRIIEHFKQKEVEIKDDKIIKDLNLFRTIHFLYSLGIIDKTNYKKLEEIREKRNKIVHEKYENQLIEKKDGLRMIKNSIEILETLGAK